MTLFEQNVNDITEIFGPRERKRGVTGILDVNGNVEPNPNLNLPACYTWFRENGQRAAVAVLNVSVTTQRANVPVIVERNDDGNLEIIKIDTENARYSYGGFAPALNMPDRPPEQDKWSISHKRIQELRLRLSTTGGLTLHLNPGYFQKLNGDIVYFEGADIDLTANVPAVEDTKRLVLVGITTATNSITSSNVTAVGTGTAPTSTPYFLYSDASTARNAVSASVLWCFAVPLFYGQTSIANTDDFIDLRPIAYEEGGVYQVTASSPLASSGGNAPNISLTGIVPIANGGTGAATAVAGFNALSPLTTKGDVLGNDGTNDIRLAVGTNGQVLIADSTAAGGLAWSSLPATLEASISTTDATITNLITYTVAELVGVTIRGRFVAAKTDKTAAAGGFFRVTFRRATGGNVTLVGLGYLELEEDSSGAPNITFDVDTGSQQGRVRWQGIAAENWGVKVNYEVVTV